MGTTHRTNGGCRSMAAHEPLAERATWLLSAVARGDSEAASQYDALLFGFLKDTALRRGRALAGEAAARAGVEIGSGGFVPASELEEITTVAAEIALRRARASALRFDPERGDGASWALGALGHAYRDAVREVRRSRRGLVEEPTEDAALGAHAALVDADPYVQVEVRDALDRALGRLQANERFAILAFLQYGMSYAEISLYLFGDETETKGVDRLLQSAREKLRRAHAEWLES